MFESVSGANGFGVVKGLESIVKGVFLPCLRNLEAGWGALDTSAAAAPATGSSMTPSQAVEASRTRGAFLTHLENFLQLLEGVRRSYSLLTAYSWHIGFRFGGHRLIDQLADTQHTLDDKVMLKNFEEAGATLDGGAPLRVELSKVRTPSDCARVASSAEQLENVEAIAAYWIRQIEQVKLSPTTSKFAKNG